MTISIYDVLDVLRARGILPLEDDWPEADLPGIGEIGENEAIYATSIAEVLPQDEEPLDSPGIFDLDEPRMREWWEQIQGVIDEPNGEPARRSRDRIRERSEPPETHCAWYCPIHFFGHGWGIYIRENCILSTAIDIAAFVDWPSVHLSKWEIARQLLRSAFYVFFLHEQFHHKVESIGFRLLIARGSDCYRPYKANVYRKTFLTRDCLEESLANAESYRRLSEPHYVRRVHVTIRDGLRDYLKISIPAQPPGYAEGMQYVAEQPYRGGLHRLQSQILDHVFPATTTVAPNMITALADIADEIYLVLPQGSRPIFRPTSLDPGATVSSRVLEKALTKHYGYQTVPGGKGSHVKLAKHGAPTIILPGNRSIVSPDIVKQALNAIGGYPISRLPDLLEGRLSAPPIL